MFTGLFTGRKLANRALDLAIEAAEALQDARKQLRELEDRLATLEGQHKTLRGRFYAQREAPQDIEDELGKTREERKRNALAKLRNANGAIVPQP